MDNNSELPRSQEAQHEVEEWCLALIENTNDAVVVVQDGIIKYANRAQEELMGYTLQELIGQHYLDIVTHQYKEAIAMRYKGRLDGNIPPSNIESSNHFNNLLPIAGCLRTIEILY